MKSSVSRMDDAGSCSCSRICTAMPKSHEPRAATANLHPDRILLDCMNGTHTTACQLQLSACSMHKAAEFDSTFRSAEGSQELLHCFDCSFKVWSAAIFQVPRC